MTTPPETPTPALRRALHRLAASVTLSQDETRLAFEEIMSGMADPAAIGALLLAMRTRGETPAEVAGAVIALRQVMRRVAHPVPDRLVDTCGTGGGIVGTLNISTAAAFVAAGAGVPIAKHGNRSFTSKSGSADVLEALNIAIDLSPEAATRQLTGQGLAFLFAPLYHPAMRHVAPIRRALGVPTMMNLLGPLANPAGARRQVVGVADVDRAELIAEALARLGTIHALVVHADVGMDEIAPIGTTSVREIRGSEIVRWTLDPADYGFSITSLDGLEGGEPTENAARIEALLRAPESAPPAVRAAVLLNAAAAIHVGDDGGDFAQAVSRATEALINGSAAGLLEALRSRSA